MAQLASLSRGKSLHPEQSNGAAGSGQIRGQPQGPAMSRTLGRSEILQQEEAGWHRFDSMGEPVVSNGREKDLPGD